MEFFEEKRRARRISGASQRDGSACGEVSCWDDVRKASRARVDDSATAL